MKYRLLFLCLIAHSIAHGQTVYLGMRDSQYGQIGYEHKGRFVGMLEHSFYNTKIEYQKVRLLCGYDYRKETYSIKAMPYVSTLWNGYYYDWGLQMKGQYLIADNYLLQAELNPHYDSGLGYSTCYALGADCFFSKNIGVSFDYGNIPVYRMPEKRIQGGLMFREGALWVNPCISVSTESDARVLRVMCNFGYTIKY